MKIEDSEKWTMWGVGIIVSLATLASLHYKGLAGDTVLDAVGAIGQAVIPIMASLTAVSLIARNMDSGKKLEKAGKEACKRLQEKHPDLLSGPKPNRSKKGKEEEEEEGDIRYYLFFQKNNTGQKAQLMPVGPFKNGSIEIRVPMTTMLLLGCKREGLEEKQKILREKVKAAIKGHLGQIKPDPFTIEEPDNDDISIVIDFDEDKISPRAFGQIVGSCGDVAFAMIVNATREMARQGTAS
jgi:hypothetical protein